MTNIANAQPVNRNYTLATKHNESGSIVWFGPLMSLAMASRKRLDLLAMSPKSEIYVINTTAE